jgi:hypothetical protein
MKLYRGSKISSIKKLFNNQEFTTGKYLITGSNPVLNGKYLGIKDKNIFYKPLGLQNTMETSLATRTICTVQEYMPGSDGCGY